MDDICLLLYFKEKSENFEKLEKADILELTVRHLQQLKAGNSLIAQRQATKNPWNIEKFWAGFQHCAAEVNAFLGKNVTDAKIVTDIGQELMQHMTNYYRPEIRMEIFNKTPSFFGEIGSVRKKRLQTKTIACEKFIPTLKRFNLNQDIPKNFRPDYHSPKSFPVPDKWRLWRPW